jgi:hypothetical protein
MQALYWSAVINGIVAVPVMLIMMLMASSPKVMGKFTVIGCGWVGLRPQLCCCALRAGRKLAPLEIPFDLASPTSSRC